MHLLDRPPAEDTLLQRIRGSRSREERGAAIEALLAEHAYERIDRILETKVRRSGVGASLRDDIRNEILLRLVGRLQQLDDDAAPLANFPGYVATVAFNTFDDFIRGAFPHRAKLKNRIRYALQQDARFAVWESNGALLCGLREHRLAAPLVSLDAIAIDGSADLRTALARLLLSAGAPVDLEALVSRFADIHLDAGERRLQDDAAQSHRDTVQALENVQLLRLLWKEIAELPLKQRIALVLSARDAAGESVTRFLPLTGIATLEQIAHTLGLGSLHDLWEELPLDDLRIALMLEVSRQQVINLRRAARERLARRIGKSGVSK